jgi:hypothetical protein
MFGVLQSDREVPHVFGPIALFLDATANDFRGGESVKSGTVDRLFKIGDVRKCAETHGFFGRRTVFFVQKDTN